MREGREETQGPAAPPADPGTDPSPAAPDERPVDPGSAGDPLGRLRDAVGRAADALHRAERARAGPPAAVPSPEPAAEQPPGPVADQAPEPAPEASAAPAVEALAGDDSPLPVEEVATPADIVPPGPADGAAGPAEGAAGPADTAAGIPPTIDGTPPTEPPGPAPAPRRAGVQPGPEIGLTRVERRRRSRLARAALAAAAVAALAVAAFAVPTLLSRGDGDRQAPKAPAALAEQSTYLVITTDSEDLAQQADTLALFAVEPPPEPGGEGRNPTLMFLPTTTLAEVPGEGFESIGKAHSVGGFALQSITVENLLGVRVDHSITFDEQTLARVVNALGGIDVVVPERVLEPAGGGNMAVAFEAGRQHMDGPRAAVFMVFEGEGDSELARITRAKAVWDGVLARAAENPGRFAEALAAVEDSIASTADVAEFTAFLSAIAAAPPARRAYPVLPVKAVGPAGSGEAYRVDEAAVSALARDLFRPSLLNPATGPAPRIELRNGNGRPGSGREAAVLLIRAGLKIAVSGNAESFDFDETRIIVYANDAVSLDLANRVREVLGVGKVEVGQQAQQFVDVTVVLGSDIVKGGSP